MTDLYWKILAKMDLYSQEGWRFITQQGGTGIEKVNGTYSCPSKLVYPFYLWCLNEPIIYGPLETTKLRLGISTADYSVMSDAYYRKRITLSAYGSIGKKLRDYVDSAGLAGKKQEVLPECSICRGRHGSEVTHACE